ncbi:MAG: alpha/beta hydrolase [Polyangiales bacterium]
MSMHSLKHACLALALSPLAVGCADADLDPSAQAEAQAQTTAPTPRTLDLPVTLRGTGSATIRVTVFDAAEIAEGKTVLAVHGLSETGATFEPLAKALAKEPALGVKRVIALDHVGHGGSSLPTGATFGELTIDDNVGVVISVIEALAKQGLAPDTLFGHSMGGLAVQGVQEKLLASGSSLAKLGVTRAVLLAPVPAHGRPWTQAPAGDIGAFIKQDPALGSYLELPAPVFIAQAFTTTKGKVAPNAPTVEEVTARGYTAREPIATLMQLIEAPVALPSGGTVTLARPSVRAGAFGEASGTRITVVSFSEDTLVPAANLPDLGQHLSGTTTAHVAVVGDDAVHSAYISTPAAVVTALRTAGL